MTTIENANQGRRRVITAAAITVIAARLGINGATRAQAGTQDR